MCRPCNCVMVCMQTCLSRLIPWGGIPLPPPLSCKHVETMHNVTNSLIYWIPEYAACSIPLLPHYVAQKHCDQTCLLLLFCIDYCYYYGSLNSYYIFIFSLYIGLDRNRLVLSIASLLSHLIMRMCITRVWSFLNGGTRYWHAGGVLVFTEARRRQGVAGYPLH